ncbi:hypothetical protein PIB30_101832 [Stylosanthes scabra]|uniref:Putative plant transposon protein domain-containing protein n=1 Tax=Stylosanthes scabra TaxID=79078 RepID=A0ABU6QWY7_9FABA|nr:hypothetical protein [Stylosanthes scabra]
MSLAKSVIQKPMMKTPMVRGRILCSSPVVTTLLSRRWPMSVEKEMRKHVKMASSSRKRRPGKEIATEESEFDAHRFKSLFHQEFYASYVASKAIIPDTRHKFQKANDPANQELDTVIQDLCVWGLIWELGAKNNPYTSSCDLRPLARGWHEFIIHNILPTTNQSEVTIKRIVLIHCIIRGQDVRVEKLIVDMMAEIVKNLHSTKPPLAFPNIIAHLCEAAGIRYQASDSDEAVPKVRPITAAVMENIRYPSLATSASASTEL